MSTSSTNKGLLTADNCAVIFIDDRLRIGFGVANIDMRAPLLDLFPDQSPIERSSMNSGDDKNFVTAARWTDAWLTFSALQAAAEGYSLYAVEDACGGTSVVGHDATLRRIEQAGAVPVTAMQMLLAFQREGAHPQHDDESDEYRQGARQRLRSGRRTRRGSAPRSRQPAAITSLAGGVTGSAAP